MAYTDIDKPENYFNTVLYTGNGTDGRTITGVGFQPDWVWIKDRSVGRSHVVQDSVRGFNDGNKVLRTNGTNSESGTDNDEFGYVGNTNSDGYTLEDGTTDGRYVNNNTENYASWNWLAGGTASSNTNGSITSTVSANTTSGFSIVTYTGTGSTGTFGHGLGASPSMVIIKDRTNGTKNWTCYHQAMGNDRSIFLNLTDAQTASTDHWQYTTPSSSVVYIGDYSHINTNTNNYIAYCFAEKKGFSKFGSYTGNGSTDGTFVYTGFKPAFVMTKESATTGSWNIFDNRRENPFNVVKGNLKAESSIAEESNTNLQMDFVSNAFKLRGTGGDLNGSGTAMIYMAFAESPFTTSTGVPTTAR